jgi:hypothetical protein
MECQQQDKNPATAETPSTALMLSSNIFYAIMAHPIVRSTCLSNKPVAIAQAATVLELSEIDIKKNIINLKT